MSVAKEVQQTLRDARRLFTIAWRENARVISATIIVVTVAALLPFIQNFAIGELLNELARASTNGDWGARVWLFLGLMLGAGAAFAVFNTLQFFLKSVLYKVFFRFFAVMIHERVASLPIAVHENPKKKDLITKVQENAMWRAPVFIERMAYLGQNLLECLFATVVFLSADWRIGLLIFAASMPRLVFDMMYNHDLWRVETGLAETRRKFWHTRWYLVDVRALTELTLLQTVPFFVGLLGQHLTKVEKEELNAESRNLRAQLIALAISESAAVLAIYSFVRAVLGGEIEVGTLAFYLTSLAAFRTALNGLSHNLGSQFRDGKFVRDMFAAFDLEEHELKSDSDETACFQEIRFEDVYFRYPGTEKFILKGVSFTIKHGETIGLVAPNGAGKSTLAKLICRIYEPSAGRILVDGRDYREIELAKWRSMLGVMLQEYSHYDHLDVRSSIRLGRISRNGTNMESAILDAAKASDSHGFISELPLGFDTILGRHFENGVELSGGQYQKLAIARILYRQPALAIFDEPTSAIDGEAEAKIFGQLLGALPHCMKILISHRFYTLKKADKICVLQDGRVKEFGSHAELMQLGGIYAERYSAQAVEYLEAS